jgi:hypothetical protein
MVQGGKELRRMKGGAMLISHFENRVPAFVEEELERLYGNTYSSLLQLKTYGGLSSDTSTYVVRRNEIIVQILLYRMHGDQVQVLNEGLRLDSEEIARFCEYIFAAYPSMHLIVFHAIETDTQRLPFPFQRFNCLEDIAMALPPRVEDYLAGLGKNTRRNIKRYMDRLKKSFPSFRFEAYEREAIDEQQVRAIVEFNRSRMAAKMKVSDIDETETKRITHMAKACGMVTVILFDGLICGGTISYRTGDNYFLYVLAHDPQYDGYWIGMLSCYLSICECIKRGGKEFHFLWGRYEYKFVLGASLRNLDHVTVYRSHAQLLYHPKTMILTACKGYQRRAAIWLRYKVLEKNKLALSLTLRLLHVARSLQQALAMPVGYCQRVYCWFSRKLQTHLS